MKYLFFLFVFYEVAFSGLLKYEIKPADFKSKHIKILDAKEFKSKKIDGIKVTEISDLAFMDKKLYGVSDQGYLYTFKLDIQNKKIKTIKPLKAMRLSGKKGKVFKNSKRDAEGLCAIGKELLISFERKPRIGIFGFDGREIKKADIAKKLLHIENYRGKNKALESVIYTKKYGVVTAPELPLKTQKISFHTIFTQKKGNFSFFSKGCITSLEFIDEDKVLVLLREYSYMTRHLIVTLLSVNLLDERVDVLLKMDSQKGWHIDNFEGLTKVGKNLYLMVSDDNESIFQKTLFVLFELI